MRAAVNALAILGATAALGAVPRAAAAADAAARPAGSGQAGADRWVPSLSLTFGATIQDWEGAVLSEICRECTFPDPASEVLRPAASGDDRDVTPAVGGSFELMTPELPIPTSPRLFVGGEVAATFGFDRIIAREGEPGTLSSPFPPGSENQPWSENDALGQGSETLAQLDSPLYGAYAGIAFPLEFFGRPLRIKPSFAWIRYTVQVDGLVVDAECLDKPPPRPSRVPPNLCNTFTDPFLGVVEGFLREIRLEGSESGTFDGIGPGLDIEMDTPRLGPFGTSLFVGARFYRILGGRTVEFESSESFPDQGEGLTMDETRAQWSYEVDPWMYRVFVGLRFQWLGRAD